MDSEIVRLEQGSIANYEKAIKLHPGHGRAHLNRGIALAELDELEQAEGEFREWTR